MANRKVTLGALLLIIVLFLNSVSALTVEELQPEQNVTVTQADAQYRAEVNAKLQQLNDRLNEMPSQASLEATLSAHLQLVNQIIEAFKVTFVVYFVIGGLALLGLFYGTYFYFKGRGRI